MLLLLIAFAGGVLTGLSPCVLPVLPVLLSGTVGGVGRPGGIVAGFLGSFVALMLFLASIVSLLSVFGLTLAVPAVHRRFEVLAARAVPQRTSGGGDGFVGGLLVGATLGLVCTPCVGPILASVTTLALSGSVTAFAAAVGVAVPMLAVMRGGRALLRRVPALLNNLGRIQQVFGGCWPSSRWAGPLVWTAPRRPSSWSACLTSSSSPFWRIRTPWSGRCAEKRSRNRAGSSGRVSLSEVKGLVRRCGDVSPGLQHDNGLLPNAPTTP